MSFHITLSGLNAVNEQLNTIGDNIANAATVGFKSSRVDFATFYAEGQAMGVEVRGHTQSVSSVGLQTATNRELDLAIAGGGFFVVRAANGVVSYTRAGMFNLDKDNYIVNSLGHKLQGYPVDAAGNLMVGTVTDLQIGSANLPAKATDAMEFVANLDAGEQVPTSPFDPADQTSYNSTYTSQVFDSLGREHTLTQYFIKTGDNQWVVRYAVNGQVVESAPGTPLVHNLSFDAYGTLAGGQQVTLDFAPGGGAAPLSIAVDYTGTSQMGSQFLVTTNRPNGHASGERTGLLVDNEGRVYATYSNNQRLLQGQVVLASFANPEGLSKTSGTAWVETASSGKPLLMAPGLGPLGLINAGRLENSNVDLTAELVQLMEGQRNYQANTTVLSTTKELTQALFAAI